MKVFLCVGNEKIENQIKSMELEVTDSNNDLKTTLRLLDFMDADILIINRLLDNEGYDLITIVEEARKRNIKTIILTNDFKDSSERKLISALVSREVNCFLLFDEIEEKLQDNVNNYPLEFKFDLLVSETKEKKEENEKDPVIKEKVFKIENRFEVPGKELKIRESDKCVISIVSGTSNGKTFISWNLEKMFNNNQYNTALIEIDDKFSANSLYNLVYKDKFINLNKIESVGLNELSISLGANRTVYTNTYSDIKTPVSEKNLEKLIMRSKSEHEILIIDTSTNNIKNTIQAINLSDKVVFIFDLIMYNIKKNLKLLKSILKIYNKESIVVIINNYVECNTAKQLESILENLELKKIIKVSQVQGEEIYDLIGTSTIPIDKSKQLKEELQELMNYLNARKILNNSPDIRAMILKIAAILGIILFIILIINNHKAISNNVIKLYNDVKMFLSNTVTNP